MATSKRRSRDVHETANEVSTDGSRRTQVLETRTTTIPAELPRHAPLYDKSTARHSTVRTKHPHQVTIVFNFLYCLPFLLHSFAYQIHAYTHKLSPSCPIT